MTSHKAAVREKQGSERLRNMTGHKAAIREKQGS